LHNRYCPFIKENKKLYVVEAKGNNMRQNKFQLRINWGDTDRAGIVFYPNYFKWFDIAAHQFFRSIGLSPSMLEEKHHVIIPLLDARCSFKKPLLYDDVITIKTTVSEINKRTFKFTHKVYNDEIRAGHGFEIRAWAKKEDGKLSTVPIPNDIREKLQRDEKSKASQANPWINA
jgi:acyl-CoA thioester hydrolase